MEPVLATTRTNTRAEPTRPREQPPESAPLTTSALCADKPAGFLSEQRISTGQQSVLPAATAASAERPARYNISSCGTAVAAICASSAFAAVEPVDATIHTTKSNAEQPLDTASSTTAVAGEELCWQSMGAAEFVSAAAYRIAAASTWSTVRLLRAAATSSAARTAAVHASVGLNRLGPAAAAAERCSEPMATTITAATIASAATTSSRCLAKSMGAGCPAATAKRRLKSVATAAAKPATPSTSSAIRYSNPTGATDAAAATISAAATITFTTSPATTWLREFWPAIWTTPARCATRQILYTITVQPPTDGTSKAVTDTARGRDTTATVSARARATTKCDYARFHDDWRQLESIRGTAAAATRTRQPRQR